MVKLQILNLLLYDVLYRAHENGIIFIVLFQITSVRQTIIVIVGYVICSTPAVGIKIWGIFMNTTGNMTGILFETVNKLKLYKQIL